MIHLRSSLVALFLTAAFLPLHAQNKAALVVGENGATVDAIDLTAAAQRIPPASRTAFLSRVDNLSRQAEELYIRRALAMDAEKAGLDKNPLVQALLKQARERILSDAQITELEQSAKLSDQTVQAYARDVYRSNPKRFEMPSQTRARHILIRSTPDGKAKDQAAAILKQIKNGQPFEELAKKHSADYANAAKGGDLGYFAAGTMVKPFEDAVAKLTKPGEVSDLVETEFGYHIVRLEDRRPAGIAPFEEVRDALEREIRTKAQTEARQTRVEAIQRAAKVDVPGLEALAAQYANAKP